MVLYTVEAGESWLESSISVDKFPFLKPAALAKEDEPRGRRCALCHKPTSASQVDQCLHRGQSESAEHVPCPGIMSCHYSPGKLSLQKPSPPLMYSLQVIAKLYNNEMI